MGRTHPPIPSCPSNHLLNTNQPIHPSHSVSLFFSVTLLQQPTSVPPSSLARLFFFFSLVRSAFLLPLSKLRSLKARRRCARSTAMETRESSHTPPLPFPIFLTPKLFDPRDRLSSTRSPTRLIYAFLLARALSSCLTDVWSISMLQAHSTPPKVLLQILPVLAPIHGLFLASSPERKT